jgi:peptidoglycan hydrolase CwlO-like protein
MHSWGMGTSTDRLHQIENQIQETIRGVMDGRIGRVNAKGANQTIQAQINELQDLLWKQGREASETEEEIDARTDRLRELHYALQKSDSSGKKGKLETLFGSRRLDGATEAGPRNSHQGLDHV